VLEREPENVSIMMFTTQEWDSDLGNNYTPKTVAHKEYWKCTTLSRLINIWICEHLGETY
jgi:hypothetical protein